MRIAIIRLSSLGDVIVSASMLAALKAMQDCHIEWFVDERFSGILDHSPCLSKIHSLPFQKMLKSFGGMLDIRSYMNNCGYYDMVVDMQGLLKSAGIGKCLDTQTFVGFGKDGCRESMASYLYSHHVDIAYDKNILERNFRVLFSHIPKFKESPFDISKAINIRAQGFGVKHHSLDSNLINIFHQESDDKPLRFLFILEASIPQKMYPIQKYKELAVKLARFISNAEFFLIWNDNEDNASVLLSDLKKGGLKATKLPKLDFNAIKFTMKQMDCVIGGDTGITHLAWAMGTPSITLYGNNSATKGKNMRDTKIDRVLLGNPYVLSNSAKFEIESISPDSIFTTFKHEIYENIAKEQDEG